MLDSSKKQSIWSHLLGNYLNVSPNLVRNRANELVKVLDREPEKIKDLGMPKFILAQVQHFKGDISGFDNDIQAFHQECSDTILSFNKEYMELMRSVKEDNLNDFAIRSKIQDLAKKRRTHTFS